MNSQELSNFLERVRRGRKITQEDFVDGICSLRQYQRYRRGESEIPYERLDKFADRLGIPYKKLLNLFEDAKNKQSKLVADYYNAVVTNRKSEKKKMKALIDIDIIIDEENVLFYKHASLVDKYYDNKITEEEVIHLNSELINYPDILKHEYITDVEILILSFMLTFITLELRNQLLRRLSELFNNESSIITDGISSSDRINALIIMRLAQAYGLDHDFDNVIKFSDIGIESGKVTKQYYLFEYFYYFKALAHFRLEEYREYEDALFRCYNVLHMEGTQEKIDHFTKLIENDFKIDYHTFIMKYLKKEIM